MKLFVTPSMLLVLYVASSVVAAPLPMHVEVDLGLGSSHHRGHSRDRHGRGHGHHPQEERESGGSDERGLERGSMPEESSEPQPMKRDLSALV
ncbi:hypothetical protein FRC14_000591 [Serendipita sp. 396]|nr:hypothetical protein FRC14_000591 [Serendipita sp. 396]KAG8785907.1 hypothetical protein FRC15_000461 [Serendipita sp. 397]KAG8801002.1 hypothetical protein FRC16_001496 [Serendipita sp. 398]KAG8869593.1 hypothetical protein FRC20_001177 [Serendipita sp. 405]